ncbi:MAG: hypothetical protein WBC97_03250 [Gemmatimonadales bacterium]
MRTRCLAAQSPTDRAAIDTFRAAIIADSSPVHALSVLTVSDGTQTAERTRWIVIGR